MLRQIRTKEGVIEYDLRRTDRKSIECRVSAEGAVVFAPVRAAQKTIDDFVRLRAEWIMQAQGKLKAQSERMQASLKNNLSDGAPIPVEGRQHTLRLLPGQKKQALIKEREIVVCGAESPEEIRALIRECLCKLASQRFLQRIQFFAPIIGVHPGRVTLREQKTKWGSCSGKGNLNFNWKLIMARSEALDYVVVHELCHLIHLNHSPDFWALVEKHMPDYRRWQDYLKKEFTAPF